MENMITFLDVGSKMSLKLHFLHLHLAFFQENLGAVCNKHSESFHWDIAVAGKCCKGKNNACMLKDYCWFLQKQIKTKYHCNKSVYCFVSGSEPFTCVIIFQ